MKEQRLCKDRRLTIYPDPGVFEVLSVAGRQVAPRLSEAVACWAHLIGQATVDNARSLTDRRDWARLARDCQAATILPDLSPGPVLAQHLRTYYRRTVKLDHPVDILSGWLESLDYLHGWALVWTLRFYWDHPDLHTGASPWWHPEFRWNYLSAD